MPLGLSYYTFQSLAYLVYCFRAPHAARFEWHELLLHLSFFPVPYTHLALPPIPLFLFSSIFSLLCFCESGVA
ncbi:hypothetical protein COH91_11915 [Neisseria meningitidis]|nr:hypothetical protein COH91_11915 [Neisseria meningitidis]